MASEEKENSRYIHSLGVHDKARTLTKTFFPKANESLLQKVSIAALLHDAAKLMHPTALLDYVDTHNLPLSEADRQHPQTLHPIVGAHMVQTHFQIDDPEILNVIRYHTTGRPHMTDIEKIVYIADKVEERTRDPDLIKQTAEYIDTQDPNSLNKTMLFLLNNTLQFLINNGQQIHLRTIETRNDLIGQLKFSGTETKCPVPTSQQYVHSSSP